MAYDGPRIIFVFVFFYHIMTDKVQSRKLLTENKFLCRMKTEIRIIFEIRILSVQAYVVVLEAKDRPGNIETRSYWVWAIMPGASSSKPEFNPTSGPPWTRPVPMRLRPEWARES